MIGLRYLKNVVTLQLHEEKCIGCGMCLIVCPHAVFAIEDKKARIRDRDGCMECGACAMNCPVDAIEVDAGVGCAAGILSDALSMLGVGGECCECKPVEKGAPSNCCPPSGKAEDDAKDVSSSCCPPQPSSEPESDASPCCPPPKPEPQKGNCCSPPSEDGDSSGGRCC